MRVKYWLLAICESRLFWAYLWRRRGCLQIRQAWRGWLSRKFISTYLRNLFHNDTTSDKVELSKWCDFWIGFGVVGTDSCCWKAVFMLTTSEVCVVILMIYEQKKEYRRTLNLINLKSNTMKNTLQRYKMISYLQDLAMNLDFL